MVIHCRAGSLSIAIDIVDKINGRCKVTLYSQIDVEYILDSSN